jgi:hypothetical protein
MMTLTFTQWVTVGVLAICVAVLCAWIYEHAKEFEEQQADRARRDAVQQRSRDRLARHAARDPRGA